MASDRLDINAATVDDFEQLIGVGRGKAEAIVKHRKTVGGFQSVSDLCAVPSVGRSVLDLNRRQLCCKVTGRASRGRRLQLECSALVEQGSSRAIRAVLRNRAEPRTPKLTSSAKKCKSGSATKRISLDKQTDLENKETIKNKSKSPSVSVNDDQPSTSRDTAPNIFGQISKSFLTPGPSADIVVHGEEPVLEEEGGVESIQGEISDASDIEELDPEQEEDEGHENMSDVSDTVYSLSGQRSRIPVPISGSLTAHNLMKRKSNLHREDLLLPTSKRMCRLEYSSPQTTYSNLKAPMKKCVYQLHRQRIPSKEHPPPGLAEWLKQFQEWGNAERLMAVDELITLCEPTQVRHMMQVIEPQFQRDFISLLPKELALYVLSFLEPKDLLQAAQTCRYWRVLAEDNLLWREKCKEENIDESLVFGSNRLRRRQPSPKSPWKSLYMRQHQIEQNWRTGPLRSPKLLKGHDDHVITCLEFCGTRVVSGSDDNTLKVWSALTGKCLRTLVGHTGGVWSSQMQGNVIISGSTDRTLKVWNADTGQCMHTLYGHTSTVRCMHLYGSKVVSGSRDATLRVWNVDTGTCLHVLMGHVAAVRCVQYDGRRVVSGAYDYMVKVWDPESETCLHTLQGHTNRVYSLQFDGIHIVSGSLDTSIRVWDVETGNCLHTLIGHQSLTSGLELKDNILVSGNADSTVKVWDITTGQCLQTLQGSNKHQSAVTCLQFNKKFVITSSDDGTVKIWDLRSGDFLRNLVTLDSGGSGGVVWRVRCSNTKLVCAVGSRNGTEETKLLVLDFDVEEKKDKMPMIERV
ncbi:F-box/WD repeat-containing protein 7-like [Mercenaria mercenaria]|uniref:F-box/WD repeat-containing protein 7-like n=1 Tax=Mercenaria mercenaria TaxID=6596 RepID=UPI00234F0662|nr:F-box/WD repeat-containing protein 7-like [Mercenaria mercenaria]